VVGAVPPAAEIPDTIWHRYIAKNFEIIDGRLKKEKLDFGLFLTGNVSIPGRTLQKSGGFNEQFKDYSFEDTDLGYRLFLEGVRFAHAPEAIGCHFFSEDLNKICSKAYESGRSLALFVKLHPELFYKMQCHSISIFPWKGRDIVKNSIKKIMFTGLSGMILKTLVTILNKGGCRKAAVCLLPWLELICRAKGFKNGNNQYSPPS
jgi:GT2 family glycosyltransferase